MSGCGKTTCGKELANRMFGAVFIDLDSFFVARDKLPTVTLSTGEIVKNYDTFEALDINAFRTAVDLAHSTCGAVVVVGFAIPEEVLRADFCINLRMGDSKNEVVRRSNAARRITKPYTGTRAILDERVVEEVTYKFYTEQLRKTDVNFSVSVYERDYVRRSVTQICNDIIQCVTAQLT